MSTEPPFVFVTPRGAPVVRLSRTVRVAATAASSALTAVVMSVSLVLMAPLLALAVVFGSVGLFVAPAEAATTRLIQGVVWNQGGEAIDDVLVEAIDEDGDVAASAFTYASEWDSGPQHGYFFLEVGPGTYTVRLSKAGYRSSTIDDVTVTRRQGSALGDLVIKRRPMLSRTTATLVDPRVTTADDVLVRVGVATAATDRPTGTVRVFDAGRPVGSTSLRPSRHGRAVLDLGQLRRGVHVLQVRYSGDDLVLGSVSSRLIVVVTRYQRGRTSAEAARVVTSAW